ncbi:VOC family protein [Polyangium fumosum]|uniref:Glyoxalase n=1 Tax=Polyangium fumosum TaxID=889272 RepID=A0A4U1IW18_9BACT|nr:VOC family protein [Polyangium fumosum]TKC98722.1 glyoxalase [Polyangium fumosum]
MPIVAIDHVQLAMPAGREDEARVFYGKLLGLAEVPKPADMAKRGGAWFEAGAVKIHLGVEAEFQPARKAHPGLRVEGLAALVEGLRAAGVTVADGPPIDGIARVFVEDPFGNRIELLEHTPS